MSPTRRKAHKVETQSKVVSSAGADDLRASRPAREQHFEEEREAPRFTVLHGGRKDAAAAVDAGASAKATGASVGVGKAAASTADKAAKAPAAGAGKAAAASAASEAKAPAAGDATSAPEAAKASEATPVVDVESDVASDAPEAGGERAHARRSVKQQSRSALALKITLVTILVLAVAIFSSFSLYRWVLTDDAQDLQGTWLVGVRTMGEDGAAEELSESTIEITSASIQLTEDASYAYVLDETAKTMKLGFYDYTGDARYLFSLDRQQVAIVDGTASAWDTYWQDFAWTVKALFMWMIGQEAPLLEGDNVALLRREAVEPVVPEQPVAPDQPAEGEGEGASSEPAEGDDLATSEPEGGQPAEGDSPQGNEPAEGEGAAEPEGATKPEGSSSGSGSLSTGFEGDFVVNDRGISPDSSSTGA